MDVDWIIQYDSPDDPKVRDSKKDREKNSGIENMKERKEKKEREERVLICSLLQSIRDP